MATIKVLVFILFFSAILITGPLFGEEILVKEELKYLGWQTSKDQFRTCSNTAIQIGNGRIEATGEKCPEPQRIRPAMTIGTVQMVDVAGQTFEIKDNNGRLQTYFFSLPDKWKTYEALRSLKLGDKVIVTSPIEGRAGTIKLQGEK